MTKNTKRPGRFESSLLDQLMKDYDPTNPQMLIGKDGLFSDTQNL